jgi:hypothetical protein
VDKRNLWESYLPALKGCISEAKASHAMCSYNAINGVPTCAEPGLLTDVLRGQWGFDRARSRCRFGPPLHPLYTSLTNIFGASISEAKRRPNPRF